MFEPFFVQPTEQDVMSEHKQFPSKSTDNQKLSIQHLIDSSEIITNKLRKKGNPYVDQDSKSICTANFTIMRRFEVTTSNTQDPQITKRTQKST